MTIAVTCNLADGVVMGVDSAVTIENPSGQSRIFGDGEKLFTLWDRPIAVSVWGLGSLVQRTIGSYISEFEKTNNGAKEAPLLEDVATALWKFMNLKYRESLAGLPPGPDRDALMKNPDQRRTLGLMVGGFSQDAYLSEAWEVQAAQDDPSRGVSCAASQGFFGAAWRGMTEAITRFIKGMPASYPDELYGTMLAHYGLKPDPALEKQLTDRIASWEYRIQFGGMPLQEGVDFVRFLLDVMINHSRFVEGAFGCGGPVRIVVVKAMGVEWVVSPKFRTSH